MSVINKMLRDLDQRQAPCPTQAGGVIPARLTSSLAHQPERRVRWVMLVLGAACALVGAAWWWLQQAAPIPAPAPPAAVAAAAATNVIENSQAVSAGASASVSTAPATAPLAAVSSQRVGNPVVQLPEAPPVTPMPRAAVSSRPVALASNAPPTAVALRMEPMLSTRHALDALMLTPTPAVSAAAPGKPKGYQAPAVNAAGVGVPALDILPAVLRQQQAGADAIAQAQSLWNTGSRDTAIDLMQQSVASAERTAKANPSSDGNPVLVMLVRELARMQLTEARFAPVWELLTRLEPLLGNQPDLWAIRANAAQRLGRHQDSVHAYAVALRSRPEEQRWLLGTAVSLAALGQTVQAGEMVEKARAVGAVSKDVLAYLRQMGVPLRDQ